MELTLLFTGTELEEAVIGPNLVNDPAAFARDLLIRLSQHPALARRPGRTVAVPVGVEILLSAKLQQFTEMHRMEPWVGASLVRHVERELLRALGQGARVSVRFVEEGDRERARAASAAGEDTLWYGAEKTAFLAILTLSEETTMSTESPYALRVTWSAGPFTWERDLRLANHSGALRVKPGEVPLDLPDRAELIALRLVEASGKVMQGSRTLNGQLPGKPAWSLVSWVAPAEAVRVEAKRYPNGECIVTLPTGCPAPYLEWGAPPLARAPTATWSGGAVAGWDDVPPDQPLVLGSGAARWEASITKEAGAPGSAEVVEVAGHRLLVCNGFVTVAVGDRRVTEGREWLGAGEQATVFGQSVPVRAVTPELSVEGGVAFTSAELSALGAAARIDAEEATITLCHRVVCKLRRKPSAPTGWTIVALAAADWWQSPADLWTHIPLNSGHFVLRGPGCAAAGLAVGSLTAGNVVLTGTIPCLGESGVVLDAARAVAAGTGSWVGASLTPAAPPAAIANAYLRVGDACLEVQPVAGGASIAVRVHLVKPKSADLWIDPATGRMSSATTCPAGSEPLWSWQ